MRHLKVKSQNQGASRRTIGTRNSKEIVAQTAQNTRSNIGKRIDTGTMPRTRRNVIQANTPCTEETSVTSSNQNGIPKFQNGNDRLRNSGEMESLLKQRNEVMPCMTGLDRVVNWKSSTEYAAVGYCKNDLVVSPLKQTIQRSSIQERISYDKVSSTSTGRRTPSVYDFKVPSTIQRNDTVELIDLTDDASESNTSSITTTQEELYSYLGVVTKSQTSKPEPEAEKTVKRSSLRVKVKQIALRNQEIYNQQENNKKLEAAKNNTQSLVRYNGNGIAHSSVKVRRNNVDPRVNHYSSNQQQYTQSTYKSTTLVNNTTNSQTSTSNYRMVERNRVTQQQSHSSYQLVPYSFKTSTRIQNTTNKCTVLERFVYKQKQEVDPASIQVVNADKYKTSILTSNTSNTTTVNRIANGMPQSRATKYGDVSLTRKPEMAAPRDNRPPQITPGIKRKAMEQWIELNSTHPTSTKANHLASNTSSSFASFHHQNMTTTTNISTHRKIQKVETVHTQFVKNVRPTNAFPAHTQTSGNHSPQRKIETARSHLQSRSMNAGVVNLPPSQKKTATHIPSVGMNATQNATNQSASSKPIRPSAALSLQTCSQNNIGNNRISKRRLCPRFSNEVKNAIVHEAESLKNVVVNMTPRKMQNVNSNSILPGNAYSVHNTDRGNNSTTVMSPPRKAGNNLSPHNNSGARVSSSMPVIAVSNVSSLQTSSQQFISANGKDVTIEVTVQRNFNSKQASSVRTIQNTETDKGSSPVKNSQQNIDNRNAVSSRNVKQIDLKKLPLVRVMNIRPILHTVTNSMSSLQTDCQKMINSATNSVSALKDEPIDNTMKSAITQQLSPLQSVQIVPLLPTSPMETKNVFQSPVLHVELGSDATPSKDLNENVAKDNKPEIADLSQPINNVQTAARDSKTDSFEDVKPCLAITPVVCDYSANETKPLESAENVDLNFLQRENGDLLSVLSFVEHIIVIQDKLISVWTPPSELFNIFGVAQRYVCVGKIERYNCDIEIDTPYQNRLLVVGNNTFYVELRAKELAGTYTRESLMSLYLTLYSLNDQKELTLRHIEFDRVHGSIPSVRYTILPKSTSFVICWSESVTHVRKYNLSANLLNLESVLLFPGCREVLTKLQFFDNDTVIAFGSSTITIWNSRNGDITCKIDTNTPIGDNLHFFTLNENTEQALFLVQSCADPLANGQLIKLLAINVSKNYSWKVICTHKMPFNGAKITSTATISKHFVTTYENGQSFLLNLYNPRQFVVHSSEAKGTKYFVTNDKVIAIDYNQIVAKTFVDHFFG